MLKIIETIKILKKMIKILIKWPKLSKNYHKNITKFLERLKLLKIEHSQRGKIAIKATSCIRNNHRFKRGSRNTIAQKCYLSDKPLQAGSGSISTLHRFYQLRNESNVKAKEWALPVPGTAQDSTDKNHFWTP